MRKYYIIRHSLVLEWDTDTRQVTDGNHLAFEIMIVDDYNAINYC